MGRGLELTQRVGIVVPTLGKRPSYLMECLESIRKAGQAHICIVAPSSFDSGSISSSGLADQLVVDPGTGLSNAINHGISELPENVKYINWLGDDDQLTDNSITAAVSVLDAEPQVVLVYGSCDYLDPEGRLIWTNKSGQWATPLLHFGPDLVPQPGALFRRNAFEKVGGLSDAYDWAFDFDLLLKLKKIGKLKFVNSTLSRFRWHPESLSVGGRAESVQEASDVRVSHLPSFLRSISGLWEYPVSKATLLAGKRVSARAKRLGH